MWIDAFAYVLVVMMLVGGFPAFIAGYMLYVFLTRGLYSQPTLHLLEEESQDRSERSAKAS